MLLRADEAGTERPAVLNNFIDFLFLYGHFVSCPLRFVHDLTVDLDHDRPEKTWKRRMRKRKRQRIKRVLALDPRSWKPAYPLYPVNDSLC